MKFKEIEFKYNADNITLAAFKAFCQLRGPKKFYHVSGYDHFYNRPGDLEIFGRHRVGEEFNQFTVKQKSTPKNSYIRDEDNIQLHTSVSADQITSLAGKFGMRYNTSIFKTCFIYNFPTCVLSYYMVYDANMNEMARLMEIEMEESYPWKSEQEAMAALLVLENDARALGITPQARVKKNLFEMFRRDDK